MKLFSKYNRINLFVTVIIFLLSGVAFSFLLRYVIIDQLDENLKIEQDEIESYAAKYHHLPEIIPVQDQQIVYAPAGKPERERHFRTVTSYDRVEKETGTFRQLYFTLQVQENWYQVIVGKSMEGTENLIKSIIIITISTIFLILIAFLVINRMVLRKLWQPFYSSLDVLRRFKVGNKQDVDFPLSNVEEFDFMNTVLKQATLKADEDYRILKEFTENASHEMQTPLAIVCSKLDLLIQDEHLSRQQGEVLQGVYEAIRKLSRLNASLLLLTKIENRQFGETATINLKEKLEKKLLEFNEIWQSKEIKVSAVLQDVNITMNTSLMEILLNNLLGNAIKHNVAAGAVNIALSKTRLLTVQNTGENLCLDKSRLFSRFYKSTQHPENTGLGLSIIKQICLVSGCRLSYDFESGMHRFTLQW